jgi:putative component of toxin-antitoxin plasmid stabilization module
MNTFFKTDEFNDWLMSLKDRTAKVRIDKAIRLAKNLKEKTQ